MTITPTMPSTTSGSLLPIVALPQTELLTLNRSDLPVLRDALGSGVHYQPLRLDLSGNVWVVLATLEPGITLPVHYHTGPAEVFTLSGRWHYVEYPDQMQTAGSYLYEPGGSVHTFVTPESNTEDTVLFLRVEGANVNFNEDGSFHSILDAIFIEGATKDLAESQGVAPVRYIRSDEHAYTTDQRS